ncbi:7-keto-8-aminopelargonate synthetase [Parapedobacter composti]|uniref:7-keto-8-aminopelargonate synthetase n=1 Tax=Parapedobacter composti TaxID=623281 RepID=A0A1I1J5Z0_9SPHI|nr:hypothetical protein [Parapedobacter composti]SFC43805.1 7-keto-8-aminopelargonate synthetase [Parapedobacter composti]
MFNKLDNAVSRTIDYQGASYLHFGGTAYLGLNTHAGFLDLYQTGLARYGLNVGTSRSNNVQLGIYEEAERAAAERFGFESALMLSSGFLAAQTAVSFLGGSKTVIFSPDCHPALWPGNSRPALTTANFEAWVADTVARINGHSGTEFVVVSNTVDNLQVAIHDFSGFSAISADKTVYFVLDDSHGIGILRGHYTVPLRANFHTVVVASLAKGVGIDAGIVLGKQAVVEPLRHTGIYLGASPPSPASMYAFIHGAAIYSKQWDALQANISYFQQHIRADCRTAPGFPVACFSQPGLYDLGVKNRIVMSSFPYPLPTSPLLNRVVLSSVHTRGDLQHLLQVVNSVA